MALSMATRATSPMVKVGNRSSMIRLKEESAARTVLHDTAVEREKTLALREQQEALECERCKSERRDRFVNLKATLLKVEEEAARMALHDNRAEREKTVALRAKQHAEELANRDAERHDRFANLEATIRNAEEEAQRADLVDSMHEHDKSVAMRATQMANDHVRRDEERDDRFKDLHATIQKTEDEAERATLRDNAAEREKTAQLKVSQALREKAVRVSLRDDRFKDLHATIKKSEDEAERAALRDNAVERKKAAQLKVRQALKEKAMRVSLRDGRFTDLHATIKKTEDAAERAALRDNAVEREKTAQICVATTAREQAKRETDRRRRRDESALVQRARVASEQSSRHELRSETRSSHERAAGDVETLRSRRTGELSARHASMRELREIRTAECSRKAAAERRERNTAHSKSRVALQDALAARAAKQEALRARAAEIRQLKQGVQAAWR